VSEAYKVAAISDLEIPPMPGSPRWSNIRQRLGIGAFGVNAWTASDAGMEVIEEHDELGDSAGKHEELYVVIKGSATFTVDGDEIPGSPGTCVFIPDPAVKRKAVADEPETTILAIGASRGEAFEPSRWERSSPAFGFFATGEFDKAYDVLSELHAEFPDDTGILYNLACAESQTGRTEEALDHLGKAIASQERFRAAAQGDSDFDPVRKDERFKELVGA
jgi:tetratricopeptide (TPR) repeat protein